MRLSLFGFGLSELGFRITKFQIFGVELAPPPTPTIISIPTSTLEQISPSPETPEAANWAIIFEYRFPSGFWSVGTHEYTLESVCPNIKDIEGSFTNTFDVLESTTPLSGDVYLRKSGLSDAPIQGNSVDNIHPLQITTASWSLISATYPEAELAFKECKVSVKWDGSEPKYLSPGLPFER